MPTALCRGKWLHLWADPGAGLQEWAPWDSPVRLGRDGSPKMQGREGGLPHFPQLPSWGGGPAGLRTHLCCSLLSSGKHLPPQLPWGHRHIRLLPTLGSGSFIARRESASVWKGQQQCLGVNPHLTHSLIYLQERKKYYRQAAAAVSYLMRKNGKGPLLSPLASPTRPILGRGAEHEKKTVKGTKLNVKPCEMYRERKS